jgi:hypothetical protein
MCAGLAKPLFGRDKKVLIVSEPPGAKVVLFRGDVKGGMICKPTSREGSSDITPCAFSVDEGAFDPMGRYWEHSRILGVPLKITLFKDGYRPSDDIYLTTKEPSIWQGTDVTSKVEKKYFFVTQERFEVRLDPLPDYGKAEFKLLAERGSDPLKDVNARDALADCRHFYELNDPSKAIEACNVSLGLMGNHPDPDAYHYRCLSNYALKRYLTALADCQELTRLQPTRDVARSNTGLILQALGRNSEAIAEFSEALRLNSNNLAALRYRAISFERLNRFQEGLTDCDTALKLAPGDTQILALRKRISDHMQKPR